MSPLIESLIAMIVSFLLSLVGIRSSVNGPSIYVPSIDHQFVVTLSCTDLVGIGLWGFIYVFVIWMYVNVSGRAMTRGKYAAFGIVGFAAFFVTNVLRMFFEIFYVSSQGAEYLASYVSQWQAFEEQVGIGLMFTTLLILMFGSFMLLKRTALAPIMSTKNVEAQTRARVRSKNQK